MRDMGDEEGRIHEDEWQRQHERPRDPQPPRDGPDTPPPPPPPVSPPPPDEDRPRIDVKA